MIGRFLLALLIIGLWASADSQPAKPPAQLNTQTLSDANASVTSSITNVITGSALTATRTVTLPTAASVCKACTITVTDLAGAVATPGNNIIIDGNGTDTINGALTYTLSQSYSSVVLTSNGSNGWAATAQATGYPAASNLIGMTPNGVVQGPLTIPMVIPAPANGPGSNLMQLYAAKHSTGTSCDLVAIAGTSSTPVLVAQSIGTNC